METINGVLRYEKVIKELIDMLISQEMELSNSGNCKLSYEDRMKTDCDEKGCDVCTWEYYAREKKALIDKYFHSPNKVSGFTLEELINVATLLRSKDINVDDIKRMTVDIRYTMKLMIEEQDRTMKASMENMMKQFKEKI
jgi:hypothetical protein